MQDKVHVCMLNKYKMEHMLTRFFLNANAHDGVLNS